MSRIVRYNILILASAMAMIVGCTESSSPNLANAINSTEPQHGVSEAVPLTSKRADMAATRTESSPISAGVSDSSPSRKPVDPTDATSDSDAPDARRPRKADQVDAPPHDHKHAIDTTTHEDGKPKRNGRLPDGDDPEAPLIIPQVAEQQDDPPINNGREPSAKPIPEGERVAIKAEDVPAETLNVGRAKGARPGAELTTPGPIAKTKPSTPSPATLADLSESIQALDKDGDGQLGLYEWPREKLAEFKTLDSNQDGFLTPTELVAGQKKASTPTPPNTESSAKKEGTEAVDSAAKNDPHKNDKDASKVEAKDTEKTPTKPDAVAPTKDDAKTPAAETNDKPAATNTPDGGAAKSDGASAEENPAQGS